MNDNGASEQVTRAATGLVVFDLDGTLLRGMTSCEVIADYLGRLERMREFEQRVAREDIEAARREMAHWYSYASSGLDRLTECLSAATLAPGAQDGISMLQSRGVTVAIASVTWDFAVGWFARQLHVERYLATTLEVGGHIGHVWPEDKGRWVIELAGVLQVDPLRVAAVGDSAGDIPMFAAVQHSVFVGKEPLVDLDGAKHFPDGDVMEISHWILSQFECRG